MECSLLIHLTLLKLLIDNSTCCYFLVQVVIQVGCLIWRILSLLLDWLKMTSFMKPKSTKIASKINLERHRFLNRFVHRIFIDFGSILEANLAPCWLLKSLGGHPKCLPRHGEPESAQTPSRLRQNPPRLPPGLDFDRF